MVNEVTGRQEPLAPNTTSSPTQPTAKAASNQVVRRIFQFGSAPSSPSFPTSPAISYVRMVLVHDIDEGWTHMSSGDDDGEWVTLDSGSDVSLLPARFQADSSLGFTPGPPPGLPGRIFADFWCAENRTSSYNIGWCFLLQHDFIVGNVTFCLVSLSQFYPGGWTIHKEQSNGDLPLMSPGDEIRIPIEDRNRPLLSRRMSGKLWIWFHVRMWQLMAMMDSWL